MGKVHDHLSPLVDAACARLEIKREALADVQWHDNDAGMIGRLATGLDDALDCYDGAMEDCDSAVTALIRRIKGEADLESAREWVCLNYPRLAAEHGIQKPASE